MPFTRRQGSGPKPLAGAALEPSQAEVQVKDKAQLPVENGVFRDVSSVALDSAVLGAPNAQFSAAAMGTSAEVTDTDLMLRVQAGDDAAFDVLVERFRRPMIGPMPVRRGRW